MTTVGHRNDTARSHARPMSELPSGKRRNDLFLTPTLPARAGMMMRGDDMDTIYRLGTGHRLQVEHADAERVTLRVLSCPCAGLTIAKGQCCQGHAGTKTFPAATWAEHVSSQWAKIDTSA